LIFIIRQFHLNENNIPAEELLHIMDRAGDQKAKVMGGNILRLCGIDD